MCIALFTTAHPSYSLIVLNNRDEFLARPTAPVEFWPPPNSHVLGGRDLLRPVQGTWLGINKAGQIAVLTNYREDTPPDPGAVSRGAIIRQFLTADVGKLEDFVKNVVDTGIARDAGGFSLVCGRAGEKLAVISNRSEKGSAVPWIMGDVVQTVGLSNASFTDRSWKKVRLGEQMLLEAVRASDATGEPEDEMIERLMGILSHDTLPRSQGWEAGGLEAHLYELRETIFVPPMGRKSLVKDGFNEGSMRAARAEERMKVFDGQDDLKKQAVEGVYATQKQTVVLVDKEGNVRFVERTLWDENAEVVPESKRDREFRFKIER